MLCCGGCSEDWVLLLLVRAHKCRSIWKIHTRKQEVVDFWEHCLSKWQVSSWSRQDLQNIALKSKTRSPNCSSPYLCPLRGKKHCPEEYTRFLSEDLIRSPSVWGNQKNFSFANNNRIFKAHPWTKHGLPYFPLLCQQPDTFHLQPQKCCKRNQNIFILLNHLHQSSSSITFNHIVQLILQFVLQFCCLGWHRWATSNFLGKQF